MLSCSSPSHLNCKAASPDVGIASVTSNAKQVWRRQPWPNVSTLLQDTWTGVGTHLIHILFGMRTRWNVVLRRPSVQYCSASPILTVMAPGIGSQGTQRPDCIASLGVVSLPAHTSSPGSPDPAQHSMCTIQTAVTESCYRCLKTKNKAHISSFPPPLLHSPPPCAPT